MLGGRLDGVMVADGLIVGGAGLEGGDAAGGGVQGAVEGGELLLELIEAVVAEAVGLFKAGDSFVVLA